jgi:hypothetical protein
LKGFLVIKKKKKKKKPSQFSRKLTSEIADVPGNQQFASALDELWIIFLFSLKSYFYHANKNCFFQ